MQNLNFQKILIVIILAAIAGAAIWLTANKDIFPSAPSSQQPASQEQNQQGQPANTPTIKQAEAGQLPEGFPADLPLNGKTAISQSSSVAYPNSKAKQSTVVFTSAKTMKENYGYYTQWASDNGYTIINKADESNFKFVYLRKGNEDINVTITKDAVNISYVSF